MIIERKVSAYYYNIGRWEYMIMRDMCQGHWGWGLYLRLENYGIWLHVVGGQDRGLLHEIIFDDEYLQPFKDEFCGRYLSPEDDDYKPLPE